MFSPVSKKGDKGIASGVAPLVTSCGRDPSGKQLLTAGGKEETLTGGLRTETGCFPTTRITLNLYTRKSRSGCPQVCLLPTGGLGFG
jgi:hypothetical protein